jgi:hypothetical protein
MSLSLHEVRSFLRGDLTGYMFPIADIPTVPRSSSQPKQQPYSKPETLGEKIKAAFQAPAVEYVPETRQSRHGSSPNRSSSKSSPPSAPVKYVVEHRRPSSAAINERDIKSSDRVIGLGLGAQEKAAIQGPHGIHARPRRYSPPGSPYIPEARQQHRQSRRPRSPSPIRYRVLPQTPGAPVNFSRKQVSPTPKDGWPPRPTSPIREFGQSPHPLDRPPIGAYSPPKPQQSSPEKKAQDNPPLWKQLQEDARAQEEWRQSQAGPYEPARHSMKPDRGIMKPSWAGELKRKKSVGFTPSTKMTESMRQEVEHRKERVVERY